MLAIGAQFVPNAFPCVYIVWLRQAHSTNPIIPMAHDFHNTIIDSCCRCAEHACGAHPQIHSAYMQPTRSGLFSDFIRYTHIWFVFFCFLYYKLNGGLVSGKCDLCIYTHMCVLCVVASCCFDCASGFFFSYTFQYWLAIFESVARWYSIGWFVLCVWWIDELRRMHFFLAISEWSKWFIVTWWIVNGAAERSTKP